jgi:hypothetical protein
MPHRGHITLQLSIVAAVVCLATGVAYLMLGSGSPPVGVWLGTLAILGSSALGAVGLWQERARGTPRLIVLLVLAGLSGAYLAANVLALVVAAQAAPLDIPRTLHWVGLVVAGVLYVDTLSEASRCFGRAGRAASRSA